MVRMFSDPNSQFSIVPIDPGGWCMFGVGRSQALQRDWAGLVEEMKTFASDYLKNDENTVSMRGSTRGSSLVVPAGSEEDEFCAPIFGRARLANC